MMPPGPMWSAHTALTAWSSEPFPLFVLAAVTVAAGWYLLGVRRLRSRGGSWSAWRTGGFLLGLVTIDLALQSPVTTLTPMYFEAHIVQHLLLMLVAPPLLGLGAPLTLWIDQAPGRSDRVGGLLAAKSVRVLAHPVPVWFLYYFSMFAFFLTPALVYSMRHMWVMDLVNLGFLATSILFWWPMVGTDPVPYSRLSPGAKIANLLIGVPVESFLALALLRDPTPSAAMYNLSEVRAGAAILWISAQALTLVALAPLSIQWWKTEQRIARRRYGLHLQQAGAGDGK